MTRTETAIAELHRWFCERTDLHTKLVFSQRLWFEMARSYKFDFAQLRTDVDLIVRYLKREIGRDKRNLGALKLVNFLQPDNFDADLAIARLATKKQSGKRSGEWSPSETPKVAEVPNDDPRRLETVAKLRELKKSLGKGTP